MLPRFDEHAPRVVAEMSKQDGQLLPALVGLMQRLLAADGCAWDREQTLLSLRTYLREEASEVLDAIDAGDAPHHCEELGDLLLQIVFQAELQRRAGAFAIDDVINGIVSKLVRRHPHVFADAQAATAAAVLTNWQAIKSEERAAAGAGKRRILAGVPRNLPALLRAQTIGRKVAKVGFDWNDVAGSLGKVEEEYAELRAALASGDQAAVREELGDALFALVNLARHLNFDAEAALSATCDKFQRRFAHVEDEVNARGGFDPAAPRPLSELDKYWDAAKSIERSAAAAPAG